MTHLTFWASWRFEIFDEVSILEILTDRSSCSLYPSQYDVRGVHIPSSTCDLVMHWATSIGCTSASQASTPETSIQMARQQGNLPDHLVFSGITGASRNGTAAAMADKEPCFNRCPLIAAHAFVPDCSAREVLWGLWPHLQSWIPSRQRH